MQNLLSRWGIAQFLIALKKEFLHRDLLRSGLGSKVQLVKRLKVYLLDNIVIIFGDVPFGSMDLNRFC
jgi:hypothetical protein